MDTTCRDVAGHTLSNLCKKQSASIMVAAGLCSGLDGVGHVIPPYFVPPESKVNANTFCGADALFQQDAAPSHTARTSRALLGEIWHALSRPIFPIRLCFFGGLWESLVAQENPKDATTPRAAIIKTHVRITSDQIKRVMWHTSRVAFASALLPTAATSLLHCVELSELDEHSKTDPRIDDLHGADEGVNIARQHAIQGAFALSSCPL